MANASKGIGLFLIIVMVGWLTFSDIQPNHVQGRLILGVLLIILGYLIDIRDMLANRT